MYSPAWKENKKNTKGCFDKLEKENQNSENENQNSEDENQNSEDEIQNQSLKLENQNSEFENQNEVEDSKFNYVMKCFGNCNKDCGLKKTPKLPDYIKIQNPYPGEPPLMKKRKFPAVLRFHKFKQEKNLKEFQFSEALLYMPFLKEEDLQTEIENLDSNSSVIFENRIQCVKKQVMEHLENVQEARYFVAENTRKEEAELGLDPEGIQEIDDCEYEGIVNHPDYQDIDFEALESEVKKKNNEKSIKHFELDDLQILMEKTKNLDFYQAKVVEKAIAYSRRLVKSLKSKNKIPNRPKLMVHGGAGSGKSTVINIMKQWVHRILQSSGDNPECPYILGTAAANVKGQTLHTAFGFNFGNEYLSLSDKKRDEKRKKLEHLKAVIIDEISMVKCDQLFQLDMRLREVTRKPDKIFGGVAIFAFGDILQLRPCQARYIFEEPKCQNYKIGFLSGTHWQAFEAINLEINHRQGGDKEYADILNRIRVGQQTAEDMSILKTRVRPSNHKDLDGSMYLACTNKKVNELYSKGLSKLDKELISVQAVNIHPTIANFKASVNSKGNIGTEKNETPFRQNLEMKVGARIMLTYNIDTDDCLTNGARGEIVAFDRTKTGYIEKVIIRFDDKCQGEQKRLADKRTEEMYPGCTAIERVMFQYSLSKRAASVSNTAKLVQFPLKLCFAATAHKFQGQTVLKPQKIAVDLRTVFGAAQSYVMLSRVQSIEQLFILESLPENKFYADGQALKELQRLDNISINKIPSKWDQNGKDDLRIFSLNCQSIQGKISHIKEDKTMRNSHLICLSETWIMSDKLNEELQIKGFLLKMNSVGHGKGLATYYRSDVFQPGIDIKEANFQITQMKSKSLDVITVYRSQDGNVTSLIDKLLSIADFDKTTLICGDINICFKSNRSNSLFQTLDRAGFKQYVLEATHLEGGVIDHVYLKQGRTRFHIDCSLYSPYYCAKDHDALLTTLTLNDEST